MLLSRKFQIIFGCKNNRNNGKMCILFIYNGTKDPQSNYRLIVVSNRDEFYDRPAANLAPWEEDPKVIGGRDLEAGCNGGAWLAVSPLRKKLGVLLNLPTSKIPNAKTRGRLVADFVKSDTPTEDYIECMKDYGKECNQFNFVAVDVGEQPTIQTYSNSSDRLDIWMETCFGISNTLPDEPLKKVQAGRVQLSDICSKYNRIGDKNQLVEQLFGFLKSTEKHLPDPVLEKSRTPADFESYSSIYVRIPERRYGTRTHTIILITKSGHMDIIESTMQAPVDVENPEWITTEFECDLSL